MDVTRHTMNSSKQGPLSGLRIVQLASAGPVAKACTVLADLGATVLRIERRTPIELGVPRPRESDAGLRGSDALALDLKHPDAIELVLDLVASADVMVEGFRPGVTERMGLGPQDCTTRNPKLVYARLTGWGQTGPLAQSAGHDINYIAITGVLDAIGRQGQPPTPPLALVGDGAGAALYMALGILAAVMEARQSGLGQVVDGATVDGTLSLAAGLFGMRAAGIWRPERGTNLLDSGAPFYDVYPCKDDLWISIGPLESRFFNELVARLELDPVTAELRHPSRWPALRTVLAETFRRRTRADWIARLEGTDACFAPVLTLEEAPNHPHLKARGSFIDVGGVRQPAPAPRFSRTPPSTPAAPRKAEDTPVREALHGWLNDDALGHWRSRGVFA
ncbi:CaiB/BaiF CoA-transferase family protein [Hydrogenophaga sp. 2FB]|uniref:CaiB/BaiF CoA transferase family protein n=1 Tax=Hydrogenophaga sp. 2FB TaxID=2502187 RepID=UPI00207BB896|nr:CaiB/BaiF CoA-transferase family protein [Hydrogenophaga sp. 2FB]